MSETSPTPNWSGSIGVELRLFSFVGPRSFETFEAGVRCSKVLEVRDRQVHVDHVPVESVTDFRLCMRYFQSYQSSA